MGRRTFVLYSGGGLTMSLSEHDLQVLEELEHDFGKPSAMARGCLLMQSCRTAWGGLLLPVLALAAGAGLFAGGLLDGGTLGELMMVAGITAIFYAIYAAAVISPETRHARKPE
jgi:hypothetical protein